MSVQLEGLAMSGPPTMQPFILYFGNDWFAENRTSSHHIARWLAGRYQVCYVECPGLRAPRTSGRDLRKMAAKVWKSLSGPRRVSGCLTVRTLLQIPLHRFRLVRWLNRRLLLLTLRWWLWRERAYQPILWFMIPHLAPVIGRLGERLSIYYCIDDYAALPGVDPAAVQVMDEELTTKADLVFVASATLLEAKCQLNPATYVSPHGVDFAHFARAQDPELPLPPDVANFAGPVIGFFGLIEEWINLELVAHLADHRPDWTFLLIGRVAIPEERVPRRPNIHYLGKRPYEQLPAYGKRFDAAIIPYRLTQQVMHANPIKLREYLAMGKPVVSVSTPEIDRYADVIAVARSPAEFLSHLNAALAQGNDPVEIKRRMDRVSAESWNTRLLDVMKIVDHHQGRKRRSGLHPHATS